MLFRLCVQSKWLVNIKKKKKLIFNCAIKLWNNPLNSFPASDLTRAGFRSILLFLQMGTKRERSWAVLLSTLSFLLLFNFALSFPLSWFIPPTLVQTDTLVQGCSHWRQVSHYLLRVNHVYLLYLTLTLTFFLPVSFCNQRQNFGRWGQFIQFLCEYDNQQMGALRWMPAHHHCGSKSI